jgi:membrane protein YqaA with SNARE-associated domain
VETLLSPEGGLAGVLVASFLAAAGWLRLHWLAALGFMAAGRLARYVVIAALSA